MHVHASPPGSTGSAALTCTALACTQPPEVTLEGDDELLAATRSDELDRRRNEGLLVRRMMEIQRRQLHLRDGYTCMAAWGRGSQRWSEQEARMRRNLADLAVPCPQVIEHLLRGRLGVAQAHLIARTYRAPRVGRFVPLFIEQILGAAATFDYADFELYLKQWKQRIDTDGPNPERAHRERQASIAFSDHEFRFVATGPNIDGTKLKALLDEFEQAEFDVDWAACREEWGDDARADLMRRTAHQRRFDAFIKMLAHVDLPDDPTDPNVLEPEDDTVGVETTNGDCCDAVVGDPGAAPAAKRATRRRATRRRRRSADGAVTTTVDIVVDLRTFLGGATDLFGGALERDLCSPFGPDRSFCHTLDGALISARDAVLAALYGKIRLVVTDEAGRPLQMSTSSRLFTGRMRDAVLMLATRCTHPGCNRPSTKCEVDHLLPWCEHGPTSVDNGCPACRHHNNWRYATGARSRLRADGSWATVRADGTEVAPPG